jgi:hypothetical protein
MTEQTQTLAVHVGCVLAICLCAALAELTPIHTVPVVARLLEGAAVFLYGKLAFAPAAVVVDKLVRNMDPERLRVLSSHPPAPTEPGAP